MTGIDLLRISSFDTLSLISPQGKLLHSYNIDLPNGPVEIFAISTEEFGLPEDSFYIELT